jgi:hypothetical protein
MEIHQFPRIFRQARVTGDEKINADQKIPISPKRATAYWRKHPKSTAILNFRIEKRYPNAYPNCRVND